MVLHRGFRNSPQYKNAHIENFVLAEPLEMNKTNEVSNHVGVISHLLTSNKE